jgi:hypothetical protein
MTKETRNKIHPCEIEQLLGHKQYGGFIRMEHSPMMKKALVSGTLCKVMWTVLVVTVTLRRRPTIVIGNCKGTPWASGKLAVLASRAANCFVTFI